VKNYIYGSFIVIYVSEMNKKLFNILDMYCKVFDLATGSVQTNSLQRVD